MKIPFPPLDLRTNPTGKTISGEEETCKPSADTSRRNALHSRKNSEEKTGLSDVERERERLRNSMLVKNKQISQILSHRKSVSSLLANQSLASSSVLRRNAVLTK